MRIRLKTRLVHSIGGRLMIGAGFFILSGPVQVMASTTPITDNSTTNLATDAFVNAVINNTTLLKSTLGQASGPAILDATGHLLSAELPVGSLTPITDLSGFNVTHAGTTKTLDAWLSFIQNANTGTSAGGTSTATSVGTGTDLSSTTIVPSGSNNAVSTAIIAALAENALPKTGDASLTTSLTPGSVTSRTQAARDSDTVNVMDFGAKGDDVTDDASAINGAVAFAKTLVMGANGPYYQSSGPNAYLVFPSGHRFRIASGGLNLTGLSSNAFDIEMTGSAIDCQYAGGVCVDAIGSNNLRLHNFRVWGNAAAMPKIGLQIGRIATNTGAGSNVLDNLSVTGQFQFASVYDYASELSTWNHPTIYNASGIAGSYALVMDAFNHVFTYAPSGTATTTSLSSAYQTITAATDVPANFAANSFVTPDIRSGIGQTVAMWLGGTTRLSMYNGSAVSGGTSCGATCYGAVLYGEQGVTNTDLNLGVHFATTGMTDVFHIEGDAAQTLYGLQYADQGPIASNSIFKLASNVTSAELRHTDLDVASYASPTVNLLDDPTKWHLTGHYSSQSQTGFNVGNDFEGSVNIGSSLYWTNSGSGSFPLSGTGTGSNPIRLTLGGLAVSPYSCLSLSDGQSMNLNISMIVRDITNSGNDIAWSMPVALYTRDSGTTSVAVQAGSTSGVGRGVGSQIVISAAADTSTGCLNLSYTVPSTNTADVWHGSATVTATGVQ